MRAEILWTTLPRLRARAQLGDSVALESPLSTAFQGAPTSQQAASTLCSSGVPGRRSLRPPRPAPLRAGGSASRCCSTLTSRGDPRTPHNRLVYGHGSGRPISAPPTSRVPTPWSRPPEGRLANRSPGTQAGAEPERARVPQKCERVGLNRWMANRSARVRDAWGGGTGPWLESGSQLP